MDIMPALVARFSLDRECLERLWNVPYSRRRSERMQAFFGEWRETLAAMPFSGLSKADRADWLLLDSVLSAQCRRLQERDRRFGEVEPLLPFAQSLIDLMEARCRIERIDPEAAASTLDRAHGRIAQMTAALRSGAEKTAPRTAAQASRVAERIRRSLESWFAFFHGYDPLFNWWVEKPYRAMDQALKDYAAFLRAEVAGLAEDAILGQPLGRDAVVAELKHAQISYSPEELIYSARREFEWCISEMRRASREMGHGDDWRSALEQVKKEHVAPGEQPSLVRELALEAIDYVESNDLVTVPPIARECWRMEMMSAESQKINPFFLGGESIVVSFPTSEMEHAQKQMSLRGNNRAFARATVHHELIPGHHLQMYSQERYRPYRYAFSTPFWTEGWTLHWEMLLWERDFARTPSERIGMLFWRLHRCARVVFSLEYHLGQRTEEECVEMLVCEAGHERDNAVAEVRRSFESDYHPLYQAAYLVGGTQVHALYHEIVGGGRMTDREFHDAVLRENCMPIATLRALLTDTPIEKNAELAWSFWDTSA
jgi:uncharacterized protein (DUF885 family)